MPLVRVVEITAASMGASLLVSEALFWLIGIPSFGPAALVATLSPMVVAPVIAVLFGRAANRIIRRACDLSRAVRHDSMTSLLNRDGFFERSRHWLSGRRTFREACLLYIDVDFFKQVNDRYGHRAGDAALAAVAGRLRDVCRASDAVGRIGGEEFAVLLRDVDADTGWQVAERIRAAVASMTFEWEGTPIALTVSVGIAPRRAGEGLDALIDAADGALYGAKAGGRNRVVLREERRVRPFASDAFGGRGVDEVAPGSSQISEISSVSGGAKSVPSAA